MATRIGWPSARVSPANSVSAAVMGRPRPERLAAGVSDSTATAPGGAVLVSTGRKITTYMGALSSEIRVAASREFSRGRAAQGDRAAGQDLGLATPMREAMREA